jgi:hypothetical protein
VACKKSKTILKIKIMKNFTKITLGLLVGVLALSLSSFTNRTAVQKKKVDAQWFVLKSGVTPTRGHAIVASNYDPIEDEPCTNGATYCGVLADDASGQPDLTGTTAEAQIENYFDNNIEGGLISAQN